MPTPIAPGVIRIQSVFQGRSGLPEDRFVTTLHFRTPSGSVDEAHFQFAHAKVADFWTLGTTVPNSGTPRLIDFLSGAVIRGPGALQLRGYDLGDPEPRQPFITQHEILGTASQDNLPAEVAATLSFSGGNGLPRERGRIYIGPLNTSGRTNDPLNGRVRIAGGLALTAVGVANRMAGGDPSALARWVVYSPTNNNTVLIRRGYMDDAFDTQRRRGEAPVARTTFLNS